MKRQLALIRFALGSARRRAGRTLSLLAALALVTFAYSSVLFLTEALRREFRLAATVLPDLTVQSLVAGRPALIAEDELPAIAAIAGVVAVEPRVWGYYFVPAMSGNFTVVGVDTEAESVRRDLAMVMLEGTLPRPGRSGGVMLGESLAVFLGLEIGDAVTLPVGRAMKRLELAGTFRSEVALWTSDVILMSIADAREFLEVLPARPPISRCA
jgi:ABC-type lipoprotein release transport system permease subunit